MPVGRPGEDCDARWPGAGDGSLRGHAHRSARGPRGRAGRRAAAGAASEDVQPRTGRRARQEPLALVRLRLAKALVGVAEANALAAESIAIERGVSTEQIAQAEALALHAAAYNGMPDPVFHLTARAMAIITGLAAIEPDPRAPKNDVLLDAALQTATGLQQLLQFRRDCTTATTAAQRKAATARLLNAQAELAKAADAVSGLLELAKITAASGRTGEPDLN